MDIGASFLDHFSHNNSIVVPSSSLLPENDPTTLFTGSGMQPMIPYLLGESHPSGDDICNVQRCIRTGDIEEVGDDSHLTFFMMLGRWRFRGNPDTLKEDQLRLIWQWFNSIGLDLSRLSVSVFRGSESLGIPRDEEAIDLWQTLFGEVGLEAKVEESPEQNGFAGGGRIFLYDAGENWWSRSGPPDRMPTGEPGGPDSEMFFDQMPGGDGGDHPASDTPRFLEIGNNVFMSYVKREGGFEKLAAPNVDFGGGLERMYCAIEGHTDVYRTSIFDGARQTLQELVKADYCGANATSFRVILDHMRASSNLILDGAAPSNTDAGYVTRRLIRRAMREARKLGLTDAFVGRIGGCFVTDEPGCIAALEMEEAQFERTLVVGEREIAKHLKRYGKVSGEDAFRFYETYGFPLELTEEFLKENNAALESPEQFALAMKRHADSSRQAAAGKFRGGLADHSEVTTAYHSTTHLLLAGLRSVLGDDVHQKGSNITAERLRFDFSHKAKMTPEEKAEVENYVNRAINTDAAVSIEVMDKQVAMDAGIEGSFWEKYPEQVKVYTMKDSDGNVWSRELCGGPHVNSMDCVRKFGKFRILKEESSAAGVRRIKAKLE